MNDFSDSNLGPNSHSSGLAKRELDRDSLFLQANIRLADGEEIEAVRIRNLSAGGLMAEAAIMTKRGDIIEMDLRNIGWVTGRIAWVAEGRFGVAFDCPIDPKLARKPVGQNKKAIPRYLRNAANATKPKGPLRRI